MRYFIPRTVLVVLVAAVVALYALAVDKPADGRTLYRNNCKVCHDKGSKNGTYTPMTLTQDQWRRFFGSKLIPAHKNAVHPQAGKKILELLSPADLKSIQRFVIDHAADSEQPATCG